MLQYRWRSRVNYLLTNENIQYDLIIFRFFPDFDLVHLANEISLIRTLFDDHSNLRHLFSQTFISHFT